MTALHLAIASPYILPCIDPAVAGPYGGAERQLAGIARGLADRGHRVDIICLSPEAGEAPAEWAGGRILTTFREDRGMRGLRFLHPRLTSFLRALHQSGARTVVMRSASGEAGLARIESAARGRRLVLSIASETDLAPRAPGMNVRDRLLYRLALRRADLVVVQSASQRASFERSFGPLRVRHIPSWAEIPPPAPSRPRDLFLFAGALRREKRPDLFLDAAENVPHQKFLLLGGPGSSAERGIFDEAQRRARSIPNVEMGGLVGSREVSAALDRAIALVNTSDYEGFPNSFLEAWAHGVPIVTIHADPDELICGKDLGIHTRTSEALVPALRRLADHPGQAFEMGRRAREYCMKHHGFADVISRWEAALGESDSRSSS